MKIEKANGIMFDVAFVFLSEIYFCSFCFSFPPQLWVVEMVSLSSYL